MSIKIQELSLYPDELLDASPTELGTIFSCPTLLHLPGIRKPSLFVSVLLHGNEVTGFYAIQKLLKKYRHHDRKLPRSLSVFFGNIEATGQGTRRLDQQQDYNRIWNGGDTPEHRMAAKILKIMKKKGVFACVDVHNNSGKNPHYACINVLGTEFINLASLFGRTIVYFTEPHEVLSLAFSRFCPAVTIEAGHGYEPQAIDHACNYIEACLHLDHIPLLDIRHQDVDIYHTVGKITLPEDSSLSFAGKKDREADFSFIEDLDELNFSELSTDRVIGYQNASSKELIVTDNDGKHVEREIFSYQNGEIHLCREFIPSMLTMDSKIIRQDCLGYLMEHYQLP